MLNPNSPTLEAHTPTPSVSAMTEARMETLRTLSSPARGDLHTPQKHKANFRKA